uniref:Palmitoyltransferase n=1 Tax=Hucho hucho TaxID=62062 RepID=A0A4W5MU56_9TELE
MRLCPPFLLLRWLWLCVCPRQWHCSNGNNCRLPLCVKQIWAYLRLMVDSLYYNTLTNSDVVMDSLMEPIFWMVDLLTRRFGAVFVCLVVILTSSILLVVYVVMLPLTFDTYSPAWIACHIIYGHWMIIMIIFHYYKATITTPGYPPTMKNDIPFVSVCKKCIIPKPARTHHCAICNTCILKMDHHCPWLNNCVGHFNQRYFFSFCVSMTLGCVYCSISGRNLYLDAYSAIERTNQTPLTFRDELFHKSIIYMWVLTSMVAVALGGLTIWHAVLISRGETSIERHLNQKETKRMRKSGKVYKNFFNYGRLNNWKVFLGVEKKSHWLTRVLLPSGHVPIGNGLTWDYPFRKDMMPI